MSSLQHLLTQEVMHRRNGSDNSITIEAMIDGMTRRTKTLASFVNIIIEEPEGPDHDVVWFKAPRPFVKHTGSRIAERSLDLKAR